MYCSTRRICLISVFAVLNACDRQHVEGGVQNQERQPGITADHRLPDAEEDGLVAVKRWAADRLAQAEKDFAQDGLTHQASPGFWGAEIVYQIQVDRFNNGDLSNDNANIESHQRDNQDGSDLWGLADYRHGGDLQGVIDRLDYLQDLGVTALWLTPVLKHNGSYHGYCTTDFSRVDPGFGSNEDLRRLVRLAHARGIKVVLDIVVNHMCDNNTAYRRWADHYACADEMNRNLWQDYSATSAHQGELAFGDSFFPPLRSQHFFTRCGANSQQDMEGTGAAAIFGDFTASMLDFNTRNYDFQQVFTDLHKFWIAYADVDGFRMDAAKHITEDFIAYFSTQIRDYARRIGKQNFLIVGEVAGPAQWIGSRLGKMFSNPRNPGDHGSVPGALTRRMWELRDTYLANPQAPFPGLNACYDFAHGGEAREVLMNKGELLKLKDHFSSTNDYYQTLAAQGDQRLNWNLLEIHDWPRFAGAKPDDPWKSRLGLSYLATAEGTPVIYYGMEQGFNGVCHFDTIEAGRATDEIKQTCGGYSHALYRQDMFLGGPFRLGSTVNAIDHLARIARTTGEPSPEWRADPFLDRGHEVYQVARRMNYIRRSCNPLRFGATIFRRTDGGNSGLSAFSRYDNGHEVLVVLNNTSWNIGLAEIQFGDQRPGQRYKNLLNGFQLGTTTGRGTLDFGNLQIPGNSVMVFAHENNLTAWNSYLGAHLCQDDPVAPTPR